MSTPTNHWKLGLFVVVGLVLSLGAVVYLGAASFGRDNVSYQTYFDEPVQGLDVGSPVEFRGVKVGQVAAIGIAPDRRHIAVTLALFTEELRGLGLMQRDAEHGTERIDVPPDLRVQLVGQGITGLKALQLDFFDVEQHPPPKLTFPLPERYIPSAPSTLKVLEESVTKGLDRFPEVAEAMLSVAARADRILAQFESAELASGAAGTMRQVNQLLVAMQTQVDGLDTAGLSKQAEATLTHLDATIQRSNGVLERLDSERGLLASAQRATDAVGDVVSSSPRLGEELEATLRELREAAASFKRLTDALERDPDMLLKGRGGGE